METRSGCLDDWTMLRQAMLERFGSSIRAEKPRAALLQLTQDKIAVLQYDDAFESYLVELEDYDESFYLTKVIFGLCPAILTAVFVQRPATLLEAKRTAEELELTQTMVKMHQKSVKEKKTKAIQHSGTQKRRSRRLHQSIQDRLQKMKTCSVRDRHQRQRTESYGFGCISAQRGAREVRCPEIHGPAAVWRFMLKDLPQRDRERRVRRQGSVVTVDLEAVAHVKGRKASANATAAGMSMHPHSGRPKATRVYLRNRLLRRDRERRARDPVRERQCVTGLL